MAALPIKHLHDLEPRLHPVKLEAKLRIHNVSKVLTENQRVTALEDTHFDVRKEFVTILGPSGRGKSTL